MKNYKIKLIKTIKSVKCITMKSNNYKNNMIMKLNNKKNLLVRKQIY